MYTSVLPLPVTPCSKMVRCSPAAQRADNRIEGELLIAIQRQIGLRWLRLLGHGAGIDALLNRLYQPFVA